MHKDDQMTPMERLGAFLSGKPMDRIMAMPIICSMSASVIGKTHKWKRQSAENEAICQIEAYKRFGNDLLVADYGLHGIGMALGSEMSDPEDAVPAIVHHVLDNLDDLDKLDISKCHPDNDPVCRRHLDAAKIMIDKMGQEVPTGTLISGPLTAAASIYKVENLLRLTRKNPAKVHEFMKFCTEALKPIMEAIIKTGSMVLFCEPIASGTIMNKKMYSEFVLPYTIELMQFIHDKGGMVCYHICGDTSNIVGEMVKSGCDMLSVDNIVSLQQTKEVAGAKMPILGNVNPVDVMVFASPEEVYNQSVACIEQAWDSPNGYVLATGCDLSGAVPMENLEAFMRAARVAGKLPINPVNFKRIATANDTLKVK